MSLGERCNGPLRAEIAKEQSTAFRAAELIDRLPAAFRIVFVLRDVEEMSVKVFSIRAAALRRPRATTPKPTRLLAFFWP
jgi:hypothetical protein